MTRINQIKMPLHHDAAALEQKIRKRLGLSGQSFFRIIRKSIDARKKLELSLVYSVEVSASGEEKIKKAGKRSECYDRKKQTGYYLPGQRFLPTPSIPPVIVGAGPAGTFLRVCAHDERLCTGCP